MGRNVKQKKMDTIRPNIWILNNMIDKELKETIIKSLLRHAEGHIEKHCANIEIYLTNPAGIGEHSDILEAIQKELAIIAQYEDEINILRKYFN